MLELESELAKANELNGNLEKQITENNTQIKAMTRALQSIQSVGRSEVSTDLQSLAAKNDELEAQVCHLRK